MDKNKYEKIINDGMVIPVFKPLNWTSFDVVKYIRRVFQRKTNLKKIKVGHAGTLDPLATGMLIVCVGKKTKEIYKYQNQKKTYYATFKLGATTPSYDRETEINEIFSTSHININRLKICIKNFIGELDQIPPAFSAIKINGKRSYELARKGENVSLNSRKIFISKFELLNFKNCEIDCKIECSKGTYIRSIANDFGRHLNSGAYLKYLERYSIGRLSIENAYSLDKLEKQLFS
jgi:tRNA pseudouridine55 synthase|tara:strand:+ start:4537 stop:5238 length:702 start_codon:yes stop_codon:yes gene_type:complete